MYDQNSPIGVFDSGVGGISILNVLEKKFPHENFVFLGDQKNAPYGEKSTEEIRTLSEANLNFLIEKGVKAVVIACNTATQAAAGFLREKYRELIIVGMEPAVKPAANIQLENPHVLVLATESTLAGNRVKELIRIQRQVAELYPVPAPRLVRLLEAGKENSPEMMDYLREILEPYRKKSDGTIQNHMDAVVLGCTHFLFLQKQITRALNYEVRFFDGADGTSKQLRRRLKAKGLLTDRTTAGSSRLYSTLESTALLERLHRKPCASPDSML